MTHWSQAVTEILRSHSGDLRQLAEIAGLDWTTIYRGQSLAGCDLTGQDLRGMDLTGCNLDQAIVDENTLADFAFDPRVAEHSSYRDFRIPVELDRIVQSFADEASYVYTGWAYKALIEHFAHLYHAGRLDRVVAQIIESGEFFDLVGRSYRGRLKVRQILVTPHQQFALRNARADYRQFRVDSLALFVGALSRKLIRSRKKSLAGLTTAAIWPDPPDI